MTKVSITLNPDECLHYSKSRTLNPELWSAGASQSRSSLVCVELRMFTGLLLLSRCLVRYRAAAALAAAPTSRPAHVQSSAGRSEASTASATALPNFRYIRRPRRRRRRRRASPGFSAYARPSAASGVQLVLQGGLARPQRRRVYVARAGGVRRHECRRAPRLRRPVQPQSHEGQDASLQRGGEDRTP